MSGEVSTVPPLCNCKVHTSSELQSIPQICVEAVKSADPLYIGLPNYGNSCYQNAALQSLLGLCPFVTDMMALISGPEDKSRQLSRAVVKLMVLRQKALGKSVSSHLSDLRDVFASIDPAFRGFEMQDANEFLLRLLDTIKDEIDVSRVPANPVRDNFEFQIDESYMCTKCRETVMKRQDNITWFLSVPRPQDSETPTLQDALRFSLRSDLRELLCQHCWHDECRVTSKIRKLPRTLILQLNRYVFLGDESKKIRANVVIPKFLCLEEYMSDDAARPPEWSCRRLPLSVLPEDGDQQASPRPATPAAARPALSPPAPAELAPAPPPPPPPPESPVPQSQARPADVVILDADGDGKPTRTREDEERELQEASLRSLKEGEPADVAAAEQAQLSEFCVEDDQSLRSLDLAGDNTYRLVGLVSHYGGATHSGHYVSDVYSAARDCWYHYDDRRVSRVDEADVLGDARQRNGYIFFYMHQDLCASVAEQRQLSSAGSRPTAACRPLPAAAARTASASCLPGRAPAAGAGAYPATAPDAAPAADNAPDPDLADPGRRHGPAGGRPLCRHQEEEYAEAQAEEAAEADALHLGEAEAAQEEPEGAGFPGGADGHQRGRASPRRSPIRGRHRAEPHDTDGDHQGRQAAAALNQAQSGRSGDNEAAKVGRRSCEC